MSDIVAKSKAISEAVHKELCALSILGRLGSTNQRYWDVTEANSHTFHWMLRDQNERDLATHDHEHGTNSEDDEVESEWQKNVRLEYENTQNDVNERFRKWLLCGIGLFHISGKPGSGKSTLMKYLVQQPTVRSSLDEWARPKRLALGRFFFWKPDKGQNSLEALIRGLLYSVIHYDSDLVHSAFPKYAKYSFEQLSLQSRLDMTKDEVLEAFTSLIRDGRTSKRFNFCFFIDGLDELDEEKDTTHAKVVTVLQEWVDAAKGSVKICVSSRHFPVFENMPVDHRVRLQDLTKYDIIKFVQHFLRSHHEAKAIADTKDCQKLVDAIVGRADGVFLWVSLVMSSIERGLSNGDSIAVLRERVKSTPKRLEELFKSLLDSIEDCHAQMATLLLALATPWATGSGQRIFPAGFSLSTCRSFFRAKETSKGDGMDEVFHSGNCPEAFKLTPEVVMSTKSKILFQCKGMLEVVPVQTGGGFAKYTGGRVTFLHRSIPESLDKWISERMITLGLKLSHIQNAICWMLWAEIHFLNSSINPQQLSTKDQFSLRTCIAQMARAILANLSTDATSKSDLSIPFQLLDRAEDALLPVIPSSTQQKRGSLGNMDGRTWNTISYRIAKYGSHGSYCPLFPSPLLAAAETGCCAYVHWRLTRTAPSALHDRSFHQYQEFASKVFLPFHQFFRWWMGDRMNIDTALVRNKSADINGPVLASNCCCGRFSGYFNGAGALPSVFDTIWILFLFHPEYSNVDFQQEAFGAIESLLVLGAIARSVLCVGTARDWFMTSSSSPNIADSQQLGDVQQVPGAGFRRWNRWPADERLRMICGQDDGIVTLEKLVIYANPPNVAAILSLIERNSHIEDARSTAARELTPSELFRADALKKHGVRRDGTLIWFEKPSRSGWEYCPV